MDTLSALDVSFLHIEDDVNLMHLGSIGIFEGPPPDADTFLQLVASTVVRIPRYRQRVRDVPLRLGRPVWVEDPYFQLDYHVRRTALPAPGGPAELRNLVGRVMAQRLDRTKPLWELWLVEGVGEDPVAEGTGDRWALISKLHHAMVDGIAGTELLSVLLDEDPDTRLSTPRTPGSPDTEADADGTSERASPAATSSLRLVTGTLASHARSTLAPARFARSLLQSPATITERAAQRIGGSVKGLPSLSSWARPRPSSVLVGRIGPHRRYAWAETTLDDVRTIRRAFGGSVNDVVLTVATGGLRALLLAHGERVTDRTVRSLVPVSVRTPADQGQYANRVSALLAELPVGIEDPVARLASIQQQMGELKRSGEAVAAETLTSLTGFAPPLLLALGTRAAFVAADRASRTPIETVTTNVPGPQHPLYALGRQMLRAYPYVPLASPIRVGIAIFSYAGQLTFGLTADRDGIDDLDVVADAITTGVAELLAAADDATEPPGQG